MHFVLSYSKEHRAYYYHGEHFFLYSINDEYLHYATANIESVNPLNISVERGESLYKVVDIAWKDSWNHYRDAAMLRSEFHWIYCEYADRLTWWCGLGLEQVTLATL